MSLLVFMSFDGTKHTLESWKSDPQRSRRSHQLFKFLKLTILIYAVNKNYETLFFYA